MTRVNKQTRIVAWAAPVLFVASFLDLPLIASTARAESWQQQWDQLGTAAKKEGRLVVYGPTFAEARVQIPAAFKKRFDVNVEYVGVGGRELVARFQIERRAGQYNFDVVVAGTNLEILLQAGMLDPIRPALVHPDATAAPKWKGGGLFFLDEDQKYILRLSMYTTPLRVINTSYVKTEEISWKGLLDPKFKGKISTMDPRGGRGAGAGNATYILYQLGEDYFTRLYVGQQVALAGDDRQQADWLGRGIYPIAIGLRKAEFATLKKDGLPVAMLPNTEDVPGYSTAGGGYIGLVNRAPHPNAAKLFVNWLVTGEGHEVFNRALGVPGTRSDLEYPWAFKETVLQAGWKYLDTDTRDFKEKVEPNLVKRMKELLSK